MNRKTLAVLMVSTLTGMTHAQLAFQESAASCGIFQNYDLAIADSQVLTRMASAALAGDFNRDGWIDIFTTGGSATADQLYINNQDATFTDRAADYGVDLRHKGAGGAVGDFDKDGWLDIVVVSQGLPYNDGTRVYLYRNLGADGIEGFEELGHVVGLDLSGQPRFDLMGAAWGDIDLDGDLDLAVAGWLGTNRLYLNNGPDMTGQHSFTDITANLSITPDPVVVEMIDIRGFSPRFQDMDGDRYPELLFVADFGTTRYWINNGDTTFTDFTEASGATYDSHGMGQTIADFNEDGLPDWYVTSTPLGVLPHYSGNALYINNGDHRYAERGAQVGVRDGDWGWGTSAMDFDNDIDIDIAETNGWSSSVVGTTKLFLNDGANNYADFAPAIGISHETLGRGLVSADYDNDGDMDIFVTSRDADMAVFRNNMVSTNSWLHIVLDTSGSPQLAPDGIGAHVILSLGERQLHRWVSAGTNYMSQDDLRIHYGLGDATVIDEIRVVWPDGSETVETGVAPNQEITIASAAVVCGPDFSGDGNLDFTDVVQFLTLFSAGDPLANYDGSGGLDFGDVIAFLTDFSAGCP